MNELWKYHKRICDSCKEPFYPSVENQERCTQCLIHPHKTIILKEEPLSIKTKICEFPGCGKEYQPTGNCQKHCPEHSKQKKPVEPNQAVIVKITPKKHTKHIDENGKVIQLLIAGGFVTEEKVRQARALLN